VDHQQSRDPFVDGLREYYRMRHRYPLSFGATPDDEFKHLIWRTVFPLVVGMFVVPTVLVLFALEGVGPKTIIGIAAIAAAIGGFVAYYVCRVVVAGWKR
jgi:hypothetical protein